MQKIGISLFIVYLIGKKNMLSLQKNFLKAFVFKVNGTPCSDDSIKNAINEINLMIYSIAVKFNGDSLWVTDLDLTEIKKLAECGNEDKYSIMDAAYESFTEEYISNPNNIDQYAVSNTATIRVEDMPPSVEDAKERKKELEAEISKLITDYEDTYGLEVVNLLISRGGGLSPKRHYREATIKITATI